MRRRDLLSIVDLGPDELRGVLELALRMKHDGCRPLLEGKTLALVFEKASLRTRVSFDVAMQQLGGHAVYLSQSEVGLGQRESVADIARVLSRYVDGMAVRTFAHSTLEALAEHATVPVINALSDDEHPCQAAADLLTIFEKKGRFAGLRLAFVGDGNNVAASLAQGSAMVGMDFAIASPEGYGLPASVVGQAERLASLTGASMQVVSAPEEAVRGADVVYTDVWTSMGQEDQRRERLEAFARYQVNHSLFSLAAPDAMFMHDLPAHRGEETVDEVIDGPQSVVFDQAENRLHAQRAILALLMGEETG
jgi:ornithine carbamoyltransferase